MRRSHIKISIDGDGTGHIYVNGIDLGGIARGISLVSIPGERPIVRIEIFAELVKFEGPDTIAVIDLLTSEEEREHEFINRKTGEESTDDRAVCKECRQMKRVAARYCPGSPSNSSYPG